MFSAASPVFQTYLLPSNTFLPLRERFSRRPRQSSTDTNASLSTQSTSSTDQIDVDSGATDELDSFLAGHTASISCSRCHADLALTSQIISKGFTGRHGRAYLVAPAPAVTSPTACVTASYPSPSPARRPSHVPVGNLPNTHVHKPVPRHLVTGMHTVCDVSCAICGSVLGWKYVGADEEAQRYKVGKFILESRRTSVSACWEGRGFGASACDNSRAGFSEFNVDDRDGIMGSRKEKSELIDELGGMGSNRDHGEQHVMFDSEDEEECEDLFSGLWSPALARRRRARRVGNRSAH